MDKIEERLRRLLGWQHQIVRMENGILPDAELASAYKYRDAHQDKIATDWQTMVEALEEIEAWMASEDGPLFGLWENADIGSFENDDLEWEETLQMIRDGNMVGGYGDPLPVAYYRQVVFALVCAKGG